MMFLTGILGCVMGLALFSAGLFTGWKLRSRLPDVTAKALSEREEHKLLDAQQAFHTLQNYSAEQAYGIHEGGGAV